MKTFFTACLGAAFLDSALAAKFALEPRESDILQSFSKESTREPIEVVSSEDIVTAYAGEEFVDASLTTAHLTSSYTLKMAPTSVRRLTPPFITEIEHERIIPGYPTEWDMAYFNDCTSTVGSAPELPVIPPFNWLFIKTDIPSSSRFHIVPMQKLAYGCTHATYLDAPDCANLSSFNTVKAGDFGGNTDWAASYDSGSGGWYIYSVQPGCYYQKWLVFQPLPGISP